MSCNLNLVRAVRAVVVAGLLFLLLCAVLGSVGLKGHPSLWGWGDHAGAPETPTRSPSGALIGTPPPL